MSQSAKQVYDGARVYLAKWARIVAEEGERARKAEYGVDDSSLLEDEMGETGVFEVLSVRPQPSVSSLSSH